ncbi:MAG: hypothetical protein IID53_12765 [Proteobacteria bacterium]|nr:hypothetical protein [Pseudomonadota bacterium]
MDWQQQLRDTILSTIIRDFPQKFWEDARRRTQQTYLDVFYQVQLDPNVVAEQRLDKLYQDRHFRMEHLLAILADEHGLRRLPRCSQKITVTMYMLQWEILD